MLRIFTSKSKLCLLAVSRLIPSSNILTQYYWGILLGDLWFFGGAGNVQKAPTSVCANLFKNQFTSMSEHVTKKEIHTLIKTHLFREVVHPTAAKNTPHFSFLLSTWHWHIQGYPPRPEIILSKEDLPMAPKKATIWASVMGLSGHCESSWSPPSSSSSSKMDALLALDNRREWERRLEEEQGKV